MMSKNYSWNDQLAIGAQGEELVLSWLRSRGFSIQDMRDRKSYQNEDIDFLVERGENEFFTAEVKTDTYDNWKMFFEMHTAEGKPGALLKSRAKVWYIYKPKLNKIFVVEPSKVLVYIWLKGFNTDDALPVRNEIGQVRAYGLRLPIKSLMLLSGMVQYEYDSTDTSTTGDSGEQTEGEQGPIS